MAKKKESIDLKIGNRNITISNPDKILFPKAKITKIEFVEYYQRIAPIMMPHIKKRLLSMFRFPNGINGFTFFQKDAVDLAPEWVDLIPVERGSGGVVHYICLNNPQTLVYIANLVCVPHIWLSREDKLDYPDRMIFDLDPAGKATFALVKWTAKIIKAFLDELELPSFAMTTGSRGVHVVVPLKRKETFEDVRDFSKAIAQFLVDEHPTKLTLEMRKNKRGNRIFLDYLRNAFSSTGVAPYAVRAKEKAPIATPLTWKELFAPGITPQKYNIKNIFRRITRIGDPWEDIQKSAVSIKKAQKKLQQMMED